MSDIQSSDPFANSPSSSFSNVPSSSSSSSQSGSSSTKSTTPSSGSSSSTSPSSSNSETAESSAANAANAADTTPSSSSSGTTTNTGTGSQKATSGQFSTSSTGNTEANNAFIQDPVPVPTTTSSTIAPKPTSTSSSSTQLPTSTSTTALPTSTSTLTHTTATSTSSSTMPAPTPTATSTSATASHTHTVISSTDSAGGIVYMTQTIFNPAATSLPGAGHTGTDTEGPNIGAIIGGIAGGLVGVILLTWLILIPIRKRAALKKEVDWMAFGSENDHHHDDSNNDSIYRSPRAGVGETEAKAMESPDMYAMSDITSAAHQNTLYSHLDGNASANWAGNGAAAAGYNVANNVVGEAPPGQPYDPTYAGYYPAAVAVPQQQQYASYPSYSDHGSPEMGAQRYAGQQQHPWPTTSTSSHGHQPNMPVNNYPFAPPTIGSGHSMSRNASLNDRVLLSQANRFSASTATAHDGNGLSRSTSGQAGVPQMQAPTGQPPPLPESDKTDAEDDCALAYVLDDQDDDPVPDKGILPNLHLANPDR